MAKIELVGFSEINPILAGVVEMPISKSISNRLLVLEFLAEKGVFLGLYSNANDTILLKNALDNFDKTEQINIEDAGTAARFILALCAVADTKTRTIFGTERMHKRPIEPLADALKELGANIEYLETEGYLPLKITGTNNPTSFCNLDASLSSQFLTSLLLVSPKLAMPFQINLQAEISSKPYVEMTSTMLRYYGFKVTFDKNTVLIEPYEAAAKNDDLLAEGDWSAAIYFLLINTLNSENNIVISNLQKTSLQGDFATIAFLETLGIACLFTANGVGAKRVKTIEYVELDFTENPDLAQPIACYMVSQKIRGKLSGLSTLRNKETDRIFALQTELKKVAAIIECTTNSLEIKGYEKCSNFGEIQFETYQDHRMAMSLSLLLFQFPKAQIANPNVVKKSFPTFWLQLQKIGVHLQNTYKPC